MSTPFSRLAGLRTPDAFRNAAASLGLRSLALDDAVEPAPHGPLSLPLDCGDGLTAPNRFAILPMEGWDGTPDGRPTDLTFRRWDRFGRSGAGLVWGGEAVAVRHDGRANTNQLQMREDTVAGIAALRETLLAAHHEATGGGPRPVVGLQLTHSGRFARPNDPKRLEPRIAYRHPVLDKRYNVPADHPVLTDDELDAYVRDFVRAAVLARSAGYDFVDVKHCHGYLGHELLSAFERPGRYGGAFENRTRFLRDIVTGIRAEAPGLAIGVRLSLFDFPPYEKGPDGVGVPSATGPYPHAFGGNPGRPGEIDWSEPDRFLRLLASLGVRLVCLSCGSPYYNPHIQRPALYPPSDGYRPPEDPLCGVDRQIGAVARTKREHPGLVLVGSGYSYLQEWLPNVGQHQVRAGGVDSVGLGRMALSYPEMALDALAGRPMNPKVICRTFSDCTTAPRNGLVSGCFPLDPFYRQHPAAAVLKERKRALVAPPGG